LPTQGRLGGRTTAEKRMDNGKRRKSSPMGGWGGKKKKKMTEVGGCSVGTRKQKTLNRSPPKKEGKVQNLKNGDKKTPRVWYEEAHKGNKAYAKA